MTGHKSKTTSSHNGLAKPAFSSGLPVLKFEHTKKLSLTCLQFCATFWAIIRSGKLPQIFPTRATKICHCGRRKTRKRATGNQGEAWTLGTSTLISRLFSTEEAYFYGGGSFLWRRVICTEEAISIVDSFVGRGPVSMQQPHLSVEIKTHRTEQVRFNTERTLFFQCIAVALVGHRRASGRDR